jgi:parallel beta-helix repeat protein
MKPSMKLPFLALSCCVALGAAPGAGRVLHVNAAAIGPGDGVSWASAYPNLDLALAAAASGDQIWVAEGTYAPAGRDRTATFALVDGVALYGGFAGDESRLAERDWLRHRTTLSGDRAGDDGPEFANTSDNCYHVLTGRDVGPSTLLDGFTVTGGRADGPGLGSVPESHDQGSALNLYSATPRVEHVIFERNWSGGHGTVNDNSGATFVACEFRSNYAVDFAGALFVSTDAATHVVDSLFLDNTAIGKGAGIYCQSSSGTLISNCLFSGNAATAGGGIFGADGSRATIRDCAFLSNTANIGGGGVYDDGASPRVIGCTFDGNEAGVDVKAGSGGAGGSGGGGLWNSGGAAWVESCQFRNNAASFGGGAYNNNASLATFRDCTFDHNSAHEAGGIYNLGSDVVLQHCSFLRNEATDGDFSVGGGVSNYYSNTRILNCSFRANRAELGGGGVYNEGAAPTLAGCVFAQNSSDGDEQGWGGGVFNGYFCAPTLCNCTFAGNTANRGSAIFDFIFSAATIVNSTLSGNLSGEGGALYDFDGSQTRLENSIVWGNAPLEMSGTTVRAEYCCIQGGYPGLGISAADPLFARAPDPGPDGRWGTDDDRCGDLSLLPGSPCIDSGDNSSVPPDIADDVAGNPRFVDDPSTPDTGPSASPVVDLGAFEH